LPFKKKEKNTEDQAHAVKKDVQYWQRESIGARKRVEEISCRLDHARSEYERGTRAAVADVQLDAGVIADMVSASHQKILALEAALKIAEQQEVAAKESLKDAERRARQAELRSCLEQLAKVGHQIDELQDRLKQVVHEQLVPLLNEVRGLGFDGINQQLNSASLSFKVRLLESCRTMPGCATTESWFLRAEKWSASLPHPDLAENAK
jgi:hypothetical protein